MNYCVIYGSPRKGNTYRMVEQFKEELEKQDADAQFTEFFLAKDGPGFCCGCYQCLTKGERSCPHQEQVQPILDAMCSCDGMIFSSPVYVMDCTAQMKALLDHFAYLYAIHRPRPELYKKAAVILSTAAGSGTKYAVATMKRSFRFWGVTEVRSIGVSIMAQGWDGIPPKRMERIQAKMKRTAQGFVEDCRKGKRLPTPGVWSWFHLTRIVRQKGKGLDLERKYWEDQGWTGKVRPWR